MKHCPQLTYRPGQLNVFSSDNARTDVELCIAGATDSEPCLLWKLAPHTQRCTPSPSTLCPFSLNFSMGRLQNDILRTQTQTKKLSRQQISTFCTCSSQRINIIAAMVEISERCLETSAAMISHIMEGEKSRHSRDFCGARREEGDCKVCARERTEKGEKGCKPTQPLRGRTSLYSHFLFICMQLPWQQCKEVSFILHKT